MFKILIIVLVVFVNIQSKVVSKSDLESSNTQNIEEVTNDLIVFKDGDKSKSQILDTSGCKIKMIRRGVKGSIDKSLIDYVVFQGDTFNYLNFECNESNKKPTRMKVIKAKDTPEMKLYRKLAKLEQCYNVDSISIKEIGHTNNCVDNKIKRNSTLIINKSPLVGLVEDESKDELINMANVRINKRLKILSENASFILNILEKDTTSFDYALIITKLKEHVNSHSNRTYSNGSGYNPITGEHVNSHSNRTYSNGSSYNPITGSFNNFNNTVSINKSYFDIQIIIVDIKNKAIIWEYKNSENVRKFANEENEDAKWIKNVRKKGFSKLIENFFDEFETLLN